VGLAQIRVGEFGAAVVDKRDGQRECLLGLPG
jgi:hypothetical protein